MAAEWMALHGPKLESESSPYMLRMLRASGLVEGDELRDLFYRLCRDPDLGRLLIERLGVVVGLDGDRLFVRQYVPFKNPDT